MNLTCSFFKLNYLVYIGKLLEMKMYMKILIVFITLVNELYCACFPLRSKLIGKRQVVNPWMTPHLKNLIEAKKNYFHLLILDFISKEENKRFRIQVNALLRKSKIVYYENLFLSFRQNMKNTSRLIKKFTNRNTSVSVRKILYNNLTYSDSSVIEKLSVCYFTNIWHSPSDTLETNSFDSIQYVSYITETISLNLVSSSECFKILTGLKFTVYNSNEMSVRMLFG